jgi:hypothetical protein
VFLLSPKSCANPWSESGDGFGEVDPRVLFIPSCQGTTGPTGARDRSDRCYPFVGFLSRVICLTRVFLGCVSAGQFFAGLEVFCAVL